MQELRLACRRPEAPRAGRAAIAGAVDGDDAMALGQPGEQSAEDEVVDHRAQAVQEDQRRALPPFEVVKPHAIDVDEAAPYAMGALGRPRARRDEGRGT